MVFIVHKVLIILILHLRDTDWHGARNSPSFFSLSVYVRKNNTCSKLISRHIIAAVPDPGG